MIPDNLLIGVVTGDVPAKSISCIGPANRTLVTGSMRTKRYLSIALRNDWSLFIVLIASA